MIHDSLSATVDGKNPAPLRMPEMHFFTSIKTFSGIASGPGFFPSTVVPGNNQQPPLLLQISVPVYILKSIAELSLSPK